MARFVTVDRRAQRDAVLVWSDDGARPRVVSRHSTLDEAAVPAGTEVYDFDVETSMSVNTAANPGDYMLVDADGAPVWSGARIAFDIQDFYINTVTGAGVAVKVDQFGGVYFLSDAPMNIHERGGFIVGKRREQYTSMGHYQYNGELKGYRRMAGSIGDPYEHGTHRTWVRLDDDPRRVCSLRPALEMAGPPR